MRLLRTVTAIVMLASHVHANFTTTDVASGGTTTRLTVTVAEPIVPVPYVAVVAGAAPAFHSTL
jgi:hypothetical protein